MAEKKVNQGVYWKKVKDFIQSFLMKITEEVRDDFERAMQILHEAFSNFFDDIMQLAESLGKSKDDVFSDCGDILLAQIINGRSVQVTPDFSFGWLIKK